MKASRDVTKYIHFIFDQLLPPVLRDQKWFMAPFFKVFLGSKSSYFIRFKSEAHKLTDHEFGEYYRQTYGILKRDTDLNNACIDRILSEDFRGTILEAGCGNGYLSQLISQKYKDVTAVDINIDDITLLQHPDIRFMSANLENLPFDNDSFDYVVCTHTLEHVLDFDKALAELRRVCKQRLIIVVPCQRPYRYTFDLHLKFFPYEFSVLHDFKPPANVAYSLEKLSGDWYYVEHYQNT